MKKIKQICFTTGTSAIILAAYSFNKRHPTNLFYKHIETGACMQAPAINFNTGTEILPPSEYDGWYLTNSCTGNKVKGYQSTMQ